MAEKWSKVLGNKSCVSTGVRKPGKHMDLCVTDYHDMTLAVKMALNSIKNNVDRLNTTVHRGFGMQKYPVVRRISALADALSSFDT